MEAKENLVNLFLRKREQKRDGIENPPTEQKEGENTPKREEQKGGMGENPPEENPVRKENNICFENKIYIMRNT